MKSKMIALMFALCFVVAGCASSGNTQGSGDVAPAAPPDLYGVWVMDGTDGTENVLQLVIEDDSMTVDFVLDGERWLYWAGSYAAPTEPGDSYKWTSENDRSRTDSSLLGSTSATKDFVYQGDRIAFDVTMQGETEHVELRKAADEVAQEVLADLEPDYSVSINDSKVVEDYDGNPALAVSYTWTNNSDETASFMWALADKAYQDGIELETAFYSGDEIDTSASSLEVKPGTTLDVWCVYELRSESEVLVEVEEFMGRSGVIAEKSFVVA